MLNVFAHLTEHCTRSKSARPGDRELPPPPPPPPMQTGGIRNISSRPLDETETQVLSYGLKHPVTPKQIPTEAIVSSVEAVLSYQHELSESTKDNIRSRVTSTLQSASLPNSNFTPDEQKEPETTENRREHCHTARRQERR